MIYFLLGAAVGFGCCVLCFIGLAKLVRVIQRLEHEDKVEHNERTYSGGCEREMPVSVRTGAAHGETVWPKTASSLPDASQVESSTRPRVGSGKADRTMMVRNTAPCSSTGPLP